MSSRHVSLAFALLLACLVATSCGGGGGSSASSESEAASSSLADLLPPEIRSAGVITVGQTATLPPLTYVENGEIVGLNVDLINALVEPLGLKAKYVKTPLATILAGVQAGRYDIAAQFNDTAEREQMVNFVNITESSDVWVMRSSFTLSGMPCGLDVGTDAGSYEAASLEPLSQQYCVAEGKPPFNVHVFPTNPAALEALDSGRVDVVISPADEAGFEVKQSNGKLKLSDSLIPGSTHQSGIVTAKTEAGMQLAKALQAACEYIMKNGTYMKVLHDWGEDVMALKECTINVASQSQ